MIIADDYPDIEIVIGAGGLGSDKSGTLRNMLGITNEFYEKVYKGITDRVMCVNQFYYIVNKIENYFLVTQHSFGLVPVLMRPRSRGRISLKSTNPFHWPRMQPNFYTDKDQSDLGTLVKGIRVVSMCCYFNNSFY